MADFNDAVLQKLQDLTDGQREMREEMNTHFYKINGRLRSVEVKQEKTDVVLSEVITPAIAKMQLETKALRTVTESNAKTLSRGKTVVTTVTTSAGGIWALVSNWSGIKGFLSKLFN